MNPLWRTALRDRHLSALRIHRKPANRPVVQAFQNNPNQAAGLAVLQQTQPYIHIVFKEEFAAPWMAALHSDVPNAPRDWRNEYGFARMEYFDVKVSVGATATVAA